jgi:transcriptional regulator with XRE-family HTH domain
MTPWYIKARAIADARGVTIKSIADALHLTPGAVGHYLAGRRHPKPGMLRQIAKELHVSVSELIEDDPSFARDETEKEALDLLRLVPESQRSAALAMLRGLGDPPKDE